MEDGITLIGASFVNATTLSECMVYFISDLTFSVNLDAENIPIMGDLLEHSRGWGF